MDYEIISRKEAKEKGLHKYYTGKPCNHGHVTERYTGDGNCVVCSAEKWRRRSKDHYQRHKEEVKAKSRARYEEKREEILVKNQEYYRRVKPELKNGAGAARVAKRRANKKGRVPSWNDDGKCVEIYLERDRQIERTREKHDVDHIIALEHPLCSGLHVHSNLQVLPAQPNRIKLNKFDLDELNAYLDYLDGRSSEPPSTMDPRFIGITYQDIKPEQV